LEPDLLAAPVSGAIQVTIPATLWVASAEYTVRDLLFAAEYSRWLVKAESSRPDVFPESSTTSERAYALATYRVNSWLQAGTYYSLFFPNVDRRGGRETRQNDLALSLRF